MKLKWTQIMEAFHGAGFTDREHGLIHRVSNLDGTIGIEEYACGETVKAALESLGIEIINDLEESK